MPTYLSVAATAAALAAQDIEQVPLGQSPTDTPTWHEWDARVIWRLMQIFNNTTIVTFEGDVVVFEGNVVTI